MCASFGIDPFHASNRLQLLLLFVMYYDTCFDDCSELEKNTCGKKRKHYKGKEELQLKSEGA